MLGGRFARLSLDRPLPLHIGDRVLLRDPGAAAGQAGGRPVFGATVIDVSPPRLRGTGTAAAAERELSSWSEPPTTPDLLRRHLLLRASEALAMGLRDLPPPVSGEWLADPAHWQRLRQLLAAAVAAHATRDPLAPGLPLEAARAELGLPDRVLVEALAADRPAGQRRRDAPRERRVPEPWPPPRNRAAGRTRPRWRAGAAARHRWHHGAVRPGPPAAAGG